MKNQQDFFFPTSASFYKDATREREQPKKYKVYNSYILRKINSPDICNVCSFPGLWHELQGDKGIF